MSALNNRLPQLMDLMGVGLIPQSLRDEPSRVPAGALDQAGEDGQAGF